MFLNKSFCYLRTNSFNCVKTINYKMHLNSITKSNFANKCRFLSTESGDKKQFKYELPPLMTFKPRGIPNVFYSLINKFVINFFIKQFVDKEFSSENFLNGAKLALTTISGHLADDNIEAIKEMVTEEAYEEVLKNYSNFTLEQKQQLRVSAEDILFSFIYNIHINRQSADLTTIKIFVVFDYLPDFQNILEKEKSNKNLKLFDFNKYLRNKVLCNYEFVRKYGTGGQSDWIVSKLMHIKDKDILKMYGLYK